MKRGRDKWKYTSPAGSFSANPLDVHDMQGNVSEWVEDCYHFDYKDAPDNGTAWTTGRCDYRILRGGTWYSDPTNLRSFKRFN